jgi:ATP-dependent RNA helicase DDX20
LLANNFNYPSPIQVRAIPYGRYGLDLLIQAKSGTGKTLVFTILALESFNPAMTFPQVLIIVPTRELAIQVVDVLKKIGKHVKGK